ncbi:hypothetical protein DV515_00006331 [Chloebia gouldiae]|uniref:Uncharacterized protein n=1 Tax=Chloebia gouldiae TaxID=44316 RepID=A0A3L8SKP2_CHLGU|nr:hypothetical protein DV515_00006331 [Chloebia gouldiae]
MRMALLVFSQQGSTECHQLTALGCLSACTAAWERIVCGAKAGPGCLRHQESLPHCTGSGLDITAELPQERARQCENPGPLTGPPADRLALGKVSLPSCLCGCGEACTHICAQTHV